MVKSTCVMNARHKDDPRPLDAKCGCPACSKYSRAYLNHLVTCKEILGLTLLSWHNLHYYQDLMAGLRGAISEGRLEQFANEFTEQQAAGDIELYEDTPS